MKIVHRTITRSDKCPDCDNPTIDIGFGEDKHIKLYLLFPGKMEYLG
jgi:hypothetical protein